MREWGRGRDRAKSNNLGVVENFEVLVWRQLVHVEFHDLFGRSDKCLGFVSTLRGDVVDLGAGRGERGAAALHLATDGVVRYAHKVRDGARRGLDVVRHLGQGLCDGDGRDRYPDGGARRALLLQHGLERGQVARLLDVVVRRQG